MPILVPMENSYLALSIPEAAHTLAGFRAWRSSDSFPDRGRIEFCDGEVLLDMSPERLESHVLVKGAIQVVLERLVRERDLGTLYGDGATFVHEGARITTEPDAMFVAWETFAQGRVRGGLPDHEPLALVGEVDWILEVVSPSSVHKDCKHWVAKYAQAGVREYWVVDARGDAIVFHVHRLVDGAYERAPEADGWTMSTVFGMRFRLERTRDRRGGQQFTLAAR